MTSICHRLSKTPIVDDRVNGDGLEPSSTNDSTNFLDDDIVPHFCQFNVWR